MPDPQTATDPDPSDTTTKPDDTPGGTRRSGGSEQAPRTIGRDDAFHVLQNSRRRAVLRYLLDRPDEEEFRMRDIAEAVAAWEHDTTVQQLSSDERSRVYIGLYQSHLPKLDRYGVIEYNQSRGIVKPTPLIRVLEPCLEEGLHADTQELTLEDGSSVHEQDRPHGPGLVPALSNLLAR